MSELVGLWPLAISSDGRAVAYSRDWRTIDLADTAQRASDATFSGITASVSAVAIDDTQSWLASGTGKNIQLWNLHTGVQTQIHTSFKQRIRSLSLNSGGSTVTAVSEAGEVAVWNVATKKALASLRGHADYVYGDGQWIGAGSYDGTIRLWKTGVPAKSPDVTLKIAASRSRSTTRIAVSPDLSLVATADQLFGQINVWRVGSVTPIRTVSKTPFTTFSDLRFAPNGKSLAWGTFDGHVKVLEIESGFVLDLCCHEARWVAGLSYSGDSSRLASGGQDRSIRVWNISNPTQPYQREIAVLVGHGDGVTGVAFTHDGQLLVSGSIDGTTRIWDLAKHYDPLRLVAIDDEPGWLAVSPNGLFDGTAEAISNVTWRAPGSNDVVGLDTFYGDYFHPGLAMEIFRGQAPQPCIDIAARLRLPGLRTLERLKWVHFEAAGAQSLLCLPDRPAPALFSQFNVSRKGRSVPVSPADFKFLDRPNCNYAIALPGRVQDYELNGTGRVAADRQCPVRGTAAQKIVAPDATRAGVLHVQTVAVSDYPAASGFDPLPAVKKYAADFESFFRTKTPHATDSYLSVHVWDGLYDHDATAANIRKRLALIASSTQESDLLVLLLSGHGSIVPGQEMFYYVPVDATEASLVNTGLSVAMVVDFFRALPARRAIVIINACQSGGALDSLASVADLSSALAEQAKLSASLGRQPSFARHVFAATTSLQYALINGGTDLFGSAINSTLGIGEANTALKTVSVRSLVSTVTGATKERASSLAAGQLPVAYLRGADFILVGRQ
jgi:WD40 repeat protein